jgi:hypothetical protein
VWRLKQSGGSGVASVGEVVGTYRYALPPVKLEQGRFFFSVAEGGGVFSSSYSCSCDERLRYGTRCSGCKIYPSIIVGYEGDDYHKMKMKDVSRGRGGRK